jgi:hypothetical protein
MGVGLVYGLAVSARRAEGSDRIELALRVRYRQQ